MARSIRAAGLTVKLIAFVDETAAGAPRLLCRAGPAARCWSGEVGKTLRVLEEFGAGYAIMAGQITPRRLFQGLHPDLTAARILFSLKRRNAETIFGAVAKEIEARGVTLLDARSFLDDQLAAPGCLTGKTFAIEPEYLEHGVAIARECARLDIGQGCVVRRGTVLAVEAFEGTDEMLRRAGSFEVEDSLFVKTVKAKQDSPLRRPLLRAAAPGDHARGQASPGPPLLEAGRVILLDRAEVLARARDWGISLFGF